MYKWLCGASRSPRQEVKVGRGAWSIEAFWDCGGCRGLEWRKAPIFLLGSQDTPALTYEPVEAQGE